MRALFDANVLISGLLSRTGASAQLLAKWLEGEFELVVTDRLLAELEATLARAKLRRHFDDGGPQGSWNSFAVSPNGSTIRMRSRSSARGTQRTTI